MLVFNEHSVGIFLELFQLCRVLEVIGHYVDLMFENIVQFFEVSYLESHFVVVLRPEEGVYQNQVKNFLVFHIFFENIKQLIAIFRHENIRSKFLLKQVFEMSPLVM